MKNWITLTALLILPMAMLGCGKGNANSNTNSAANVSNSNSGATESLTEFADAPAALAEGNRLFDINKTDRAIEAFKKAVELDPDLGEAWFKLGIAHSLIEREKELEAVNDQTEYTPTPTPSKKEKQTVRTKESEKAFENAVKAYKKQLSANPKDDVAHYNLGRTYDKLDEDEDALKSLKEAVRLKPDSTEYQTELGSIQIKMAQYDEAVRSLKKAIELDPENSQAEEMLEKAEAGKKRINFSVTPKPQQTSGSSNTKEKLTDDSGGDASPTSPKSTPGKPTNPKVDKKGNP